MFFYFALVSSYYAHWVITLYNTPSGYSANFINLFIIKYMIFYTKINY